ncbi:NCS1 nucleoside transporter [Jaminaea rosea]|uniref:NCS1 nucleoside transporter n=1 Tax=Jaminaea rosea TaxID=1569628 RepID=A0A316ULA7_9BASI|nr:NCS1 nucleoside transporter [Jaminaea rosea]PWN26047.1 NCS1 nucleoside transporter [Jaminaea rosea]
MTDSEATRKTKLTILRDRLEVNDGPGGKSTAFINNDIVPLEPARRLWGPVSFAGFWLVCSVNISNWTMGSALISLGPNVRQCVAAIIVGNIIVGIGVVLTGAPGAKWHIPFAVTCRSTWGMWGSFFPLANRQILSFTWSACQSYFGARCVRILIGSMVPSFYKWSQPLAGGTLDSATLVSFVIFVLLQMPLLLVRPQHYRNPFLYFSGAVSLLCVVMLTWAMAKAGGAGALVRDSSAISGVTQVHGTKLSWAMLYAVNTVIGSICAGMLNQSDYSRYARKPYDQVWAQALAIPLSRTFCGTIGIIVTSCAAQWWPDKGLLWMPPDLLEQIQANDNVGKTRLAVFLAALVFLSSQLGINVADNLTASGIDLASMFPRWMTIRRGAYFTALVSVLIQPWQLLNGSSVYLSVMGSYGVFLGPLTGLLIADYHVVRQRKLKLSHLYEATPETTYSFFCGFNPRALLAWVLGVLPAFPGFVHNVSHKGDFTNYNVGWSRLFHFCWLIGLTISAFVFTALCYVWPPQGLGHVDDYDVFGTFGQAEAARGSGEKESPDEKGAKEGSQQVTVVELV